MSLSEPPLLLITDRAMARRPLREVAAAALRGGCRWVMVREKDLAEAALARLVTDIIELARPYGAAVSVNGAARVAADCGARGVHLPQGHAVAEARRAVGRDALVGVSAHSFEEAANAAGEGADYLTASPVFATASKPGYGPALGLEGLSRLAGAVDIPVLALGGVTAANAADCLAAGAAGVAVMGAVMRARDPERAVAALVVALTAVPTARWRGAFRP